MAQSLAAELVQLLKGLSATFTVKISHLVTLIFHHKNTSSLGAIAGLAIALLCTWKYVKVLARRRKKIQKPEHISSTFSAPEGAAIGTSTAVTKGIMQPTQRSGTIPEASAPFEVSLAQLVRQQLLGGRKVTCQLLGIILEETSAEELQKHAVVRPHVVEVLLELTGACDMYIFAKVLDDESEVSVLAALDAVGAFSLGGLTRNKVSERPC
ncbi:hypothetical protein O6H91_17G020900 [Diphasiastrum complanatum]|uniref:Uncharacterized protein n=1 Tax=Diphasiastrum complanatum TaxID=34168 RepID=A0ACC2B4T5_DIPCM|nr:hypothetical protein O6H91_17G020900 [Diphasiastrum complanatum]